MSKSSHLRRASRRSETGVAWCRCRNQLVNSGLRNSGDLAMSPSRSRILLMFAAIGLFPGAAPLRGQRLEPEWVDMTPSGKLVVKAWEVAGGTLSIRGGLI